MQRTRTDFLALTISAGSGTEESAADLWRDDEMSLARRNSRRYRFTVTVTSDATGARTRFTYHGSIADHDAGTDQLDRAALLYAFRCFVEDADAGEQTFEEFADSYGYDQDSYRARQTHKACRTARAKFARLWHDPERFTPAYILEQLEHEGIS